MSDRLIITATLPEGVADGEGEDEPGLPLPARGASIGRFLVLGVLGRGGMGIVLSAYDGDLDRKVALKLLHGGGAAGARRDALVREAQVMARLQHPNVVAVHEIGFVDETAYVVMEQVPGKTLRAWLGEEPRGWRELLEVFGQAGAGLAAAHRAGVIHRDFKPDNVLVGESGRAQVSDFGLASPAEELAGRQAGTRAYMAPEQAAPDATRRIDARADQYAFCVSLWEALTGDRPAPDPRPPRERRAPAHVYRALARGLAARPDDRFATMEALLRALRPLERRGRVIAAALVLGAAAAAFAAGRIGSGAPACAGGEAEVASVWDAAAGARVAAAFRATGRPFAEATFERVDRALRGRLGAWSAAHREACEATRVRHVQSDTMLDLRMACLGRARGEVAALVTQLGQADAAVVERAAQAAAVAGDLDACADAAALAAAIPPPRDPEGARQVGELRAELARVGALRQLGQWKPGLEAARALVARARAVGFVPVVASSLSALAAFELNGGSTDAAIDALYETVRLGSLAHDDELVADALGELVYAHGFDKAQPAAAEVAYQTATAAAERAGSPARLLARVYRARGYALSRQGDYKAALPLRQIVLGLQVKVYGPESQQTAIALQEIAATTYYLGEGAAAKPIYARAIAVAEKALGPDHPTVAGLLTNAGIALTDAQDLDGAVALLERALALRERAYGPDTLKVADTAQGLADARLAQRRLPAARQLLERVIRIRTALLGADDGKVAFAQASLALVAQREGKPAEAHALLQHALAVQTAQDGAESLVLVNAYRYDAGVLLDLGRLAEAHAAAERALAIEVKALGEEHPDRAETLRLFAAVLAAERRPLEAVPVYERALAMWERQYGPDSPALIDTLIGSCEARVALHDGDGARAAARRAVGLAAASAAEVRAGADFCLARAEWEPGGDPRRALELARAARAGLTGAGAAPSDLAQVDGWLARHRP